MILAGLSHKAKVCPKATNSVCRRHNAFLVNNRAKSRLEVNKAYHPHCALPQISAFSTAEDLDLSGKRIQSLFKSVRDIPKVDQDQAPVSESIHTID